MYEHPSVEDEAEPGLRQEHNDMAGLSQSATETLAPRKSGDSPLMKLPEDVRSRIYNHVLGGYVVHISALADPQPPKISHSVCKEDKSVCPAVSKLVGSHQVTANPEPIDQRALYRAIKDDHLSSSERLPVQLLLVSRQIHSEAAHVPFARNVFVFHKREGRVFNLLQTLPAFAMAVSLKQRREIRNVVLLRFVGKGLGYERLLITTSFSLRDILPGVQRLWLDVFVPQAFESGGDKPVGYIREQRIRTRWETLRKGLDDLMGARLVAVGALVFIDDHEDGDDDGVVVDNIIRDWEETERAIAGEIEKLLLFRIPERTPDAARIWAGHEMLGPPRRQRSGLEHMIEEVVWGEYYARNYTREIEREFQYWVDVEFEDFVDLMFNEALDEVTEKE